MVKRDYIKIAGLLKKHKPEHTEPISGVAYSPRDLFNYLVSDLMAMFKQDNPKFDEDKFREYIYGG